MFAEWLSTVATAMQNVAFEPVGNFRKRSSVNHVSEQDYNSEEPFKELSECD